MQGMIDFENPVQCTPAPPAPDMLILEMSKGEILGKALKTFDTEISIDEPARITQDGIWKCNQFIPYPKGISVKGEGEAVIKLELIYRILDNHYKNPSRNLIVNSRGYADNVKRRKGKYGNTPTGLSKEYVRIEINGKVQVRTGNFIATLPSAPAAE